ncbi:hypothetical protein D9758_006046 [Tetrapyrgos nigripes]|uniref:CUE domain-containing protein n=1 Tax=Tetrapyrgos nigripes TaxID=182062 RepID=A0A8H5D7Z6_9AGAR|nr:hypothetical protein D9758_006046 [Tetrapyrgos nigripes]
MDTDVLEHLPPYPSSHARKSLPASQLAILNQKIAICLTSTLSLPPAKCDKPATRTFIATYASDTALQTLQSLIWEPDTSSSKDEKLIRRNVLRLAERLAPSLNAQTLVDLAVVYGTINPSRTRTVFAAAFKTNSSLSNAGPELVSAFTTLLESGESLGLYNLRKSSHCISCLLRVLPPEALQYFAHSKDFYIAIAKAYDQRLVSIANSYGGLSIIQNAEGRELAWDDWEKIWLETKVALMDSFHACISFLLKQLAAASGRNLAVEVERAFEIVFGLLQLDSSASDGSSPTPFLNQSLLADYQHSYDLTRTLSAALRHAEERDARLDLLESSLRSLDGASSGSSSPGAGSSTHKNPGVLKLLLRSSGVPVGVDNLGKGKHVDKGKAKEVYLSEPVHASSSNPDPDLDVKISQVLDIFPDQSPEYIKALLSHSSYPFHGNPEKLIEALLEGTAPPYEQLLQTEETSVPANKEAYSVSERRNIFDDNEMDLSKLRVGKKAENETTFLRDRAFIEQMKADILRRAEQLSDEEDEEMEERKEETLAFEDDVELDGHVKVLGDGEESGEDSDEEAPQGSETILELAYIRDPKLFDRDANTRRSKARAELKAQTNLDDEQIEGWRIMLERNPKKEQILQKHEFSGNKPGPIQAEQPNIGSSRGRGGHGGRGRGGRGRGSGGGGRGGGGGGGNSARERAWKDKNKGTRANHDRKRGHDKKNG